jgi:hypothetical protein
MSRARRKHDRPVEQLRTTCTSTEDLEETLNEMFRLSGHGPVLTGSPTPSSHVDCAALPTPGLEMPSVVEETSTVEETGRGGTETATVEETSTVERTGTTGRPQLRPITAAPSPTTVADSVEVTSTVEGTQTLEKSPGPDTGTEEETTTVEDTLPPRLVRVSPPL